MKDAITGIHHVTAISGPAQQNVDFYAGVLGMRFVKKTVNFDDPGTYHLYYGDAVGSPGSIMTFFPWAHAVRGRPGSGMVGTTSFSVPEESIGFWSNRLQEAGVSRQRHGNRFEHPVLAFKDPHGLELELAGVSGSAAEGRPWGAIDPGRAILGFHGVRLLVARPESTASLLTDVFGYEFVSEEDGRRRFRSSASVTGAHIDVEKRMDNGRPGAGTVHHVAFRARDEEQQLAWREAVRSAGLFVTEVKDRNYFKSIYFREPNGVLFEIATDPPGFAADEPLDGLGEELKLPPWLEPQRSAIEERLDELHLPVVGERTE